MTIYTFFVLFDSHHFLIFSIVLCNHKHELLCFTPFLGVSIFVKPFEYLLLINDRCAGGI